MYYKASIYDVWNGWFNFRSVSHSLHTFLELSSSLTSFSSVTINLHYRLLTIILFWNSLTRTTKSKRSRIQSQFSIQLSFFWWFAYPFTQAQRHICWIFHKIRFFFIAQLINISCIDLWKYFILEDNRSKWNQISISS